jgi:hypothetical protein
MTKKKTEELVDETPVSEETESNPTNETPVEEPVTPVVEGEPTPEYVDQDAKSTPTGFVPIDARPQVTEDGKPIIYPDVASGRN